MILGLTKNETYISENKFQFITDFSKHQYVDVNGETHELNFGELTIVERVMLSGYLTYLCKNAGKNKPKHQDVYSLIFNFNERKIKKAPTYYDYFIKDLSKFIAREPYFFSFIHSNFDRIEDDRTFIYRQQLNHSEMELLYSLTFRKQYQSLLTVLYILGISKQNLVSVQLNKVTLANFYSNNITLSKKRVDEIFKTINISSKNKVNYVIKDDTIYFGNGFEIDETEEFASAEKRKYDKIKNEADILANLTRK